MPPCNTTVRSIFLEHKLLSETSVCPLRLLLSYWAPTVARTKECRQSGRLFVGI